MTDDMRLVPRPREPIHWLTAVVVIIWLILIVLAILDIT